MAVQTLKDNSEKLFGRAADLERLRQRAGRTGLTAVVGPAQIGKSWLLLELARQLAEAVSPRTLVGYTASPGGAFDPLLQVVSDLYQRWLSEAGVWAQVRMAREQRKDRLLPSFAKFVGRLSEKAAKSVPGVGEVFGAAIRESMDALVAAGEDLHSGRLIVSRLEHRQAQELVASVRAISGRPVVLVMDQWEESRGLDVQATLIRDVLRAPEQWDGCHIVVGARAGSEAAATLETLRKDFPGRAHIHQLAEMDLPDAAEQRRMVGFLRPQVPGIWNSDDDAVMELVGGYPRVIDRWLADDSRDKARTLDGLRDLVRESIQYRYSDLETLLMALDGDRRKLAVRLALVPLVEDASAWSALRPVLLADIDTDALDDLKDRNILDRDAECPNFGHPTRRDAARTFLAGRRSAAVTTEANALSLGLARAIVAIDDSGVPFALALRGLPEAAGQRSLGQVALALCQAAVALLNERPEYPSALLDGALQARQSRISGIGLPLGAAIVNTLDPDKAEDALARRDALLDELRALAAAWPGDAAVRENLAMGLYNTLNAAKAEGALARRDALLEELRGLCAAFPDEGIVGKIVATGLFDAPDED